MFDAINATHQKIGHGGEKKTFREAQNGNVPFVSHVLIENLKPQKILLLTNCISFGKLFKVLKKYYLDY
ncbi:hypothetical protein T11_5637 [Trichinella zimbabwensis]|uniref:KRAB-A domain-containing protein 2 n=1 Tax=Trichinella zimbabwensis TaxID=268475 RepID=A0A0V1HQH4_9BILA|nr:hypothetical protein T11_5637 [Trichinella zimbabwensis]